MLLKNKSKFTTRQCDQIRTWKKWFERKEGENLKEGQFFKKNTNKH
jgi:hypothetical protein